MLTTSPCLLLVDDDPEERYLMHLALTDIGWQDAVSFFSSAETVLRFLLTRPLTALPTFLLLDYRMPGMNGDELIRLLKKSSMLRHLPVAVYSSNLTRDMEQMLLLDGALCCFKKAQNRQEAVALAERLRSLTLTSVNIGN